MANKLQGKPVRLLAARLNEPDCNIFCLPLGFRNVLLDLAERLEWAATWIDENGDRQPLTDTQRQIIEEGLEGLTMPCEIVINNSFTIDPPITVNVSGGGGGGGCCNTEFVVPIGPGGDSYPLIPVNPNDPLETTVPVWDPVTQTPPDGYDDWYAFDSDRCRAANWFVDSYIEFVQNLDILERRLSAGAAIMEVATLLVKALPGPVGEYAGTLVIIKWTTDILRWLSEVVDELEDLNDWLQLGTDAIENNKAELVCAAYSMSSVAYLKEFFATFFAGYVEPDLVTAGVPTDGVTFLRNTFDGLFSLMAEKVASAFANQHIPEDYVPSYTCENCGQAAGFSYVPMTIASIHQIVGHGSITNKVGTVAPGGDAFSLSGDAGVANATMGAELLLVDPGIQPAKVYGIAVRVEGENINAMYLGDTSQSSLWDGTTLYYAPGATHVVRGPANTSYPNILPGVRTIAKHDGVNVNSCDLTAFLSLTVGCRMTVAGAGCNMVLTDMYWIIWDSAAC